MPDVRGDSPLHASACNGHTQIVAMLLQLKVNINLKNAMGFTPVALARMNGHLQCVELLQLTEKANLPKTGVIDGVDIGKLNKDYFGLAADYRSQQPYREAAQGLCVVGLPEGDFRTVVWCWCVCVWVGVWVSLIHACVVLCVSVSRIPVVPVAVPRAGEVCAVQEGGGGKGVHPL